MGKKTRKTRWRTLPIGDERSDSEESNSTLDTRIHPTYHQKYNSRLTYSSQSTPTRRYQSDSNKSTRSSSTTSENKITFNEDEYTRITTPRQDVLFKKGYLNKPKTYSTQTSTGNSTTSTGNSTTSTGNGTPDYQSTDLEYESHFVFPNGFMDQSGIYYVNGYDPYPLVVYNGPPYYNNETCNRAKKYTTESSTETTITNEENAQDVVNHSVEIQGDGVQHTAPPQINGNLHQSSHIAAPVEYSQVYNVLYPGFYYESCPPPQEQVNGQVHQSEPKRIKRRRRRKLSSTKVEDKQMEDTTSEYSEDDVSSVNEEELNGHDPVEENQTNQDLPTAASPLLTYNEKLETENPSTTPHSTSESQKETETESTVPLLSDPVNVDTTKCDTNGHQSENSELQTVCTDQPSQNNTAQDSSTSDEKKLRYDLKPDAQEFIPRCMRPDSVQFFKIPPNFVPVPMLNPMGTQNYNHPYLPVNFIQQGAPIYPGFVPGFVPPNFNPVEAHHALHLVPNGDPYHSNHQTEIYPSHEVNNKADVDIRTVVSKLEEVVNDPSKSESSIERRNKNSPNISPSKKTSFKHYDERKKYQQKNNRQNGYFHKKPYNRYQNISSTFNSNHCEQETDEQEECSKPETPKVHVNDSTESLKNSEKEIEEPTSEMLLSRTCQSSIQNGSSDKENKIKPKTVNIEVLNNSVTSKEEKKEECSTRVEKICSSSKLQIRSTNEKPLNTPKAPTNNSDNNSVSQRRFSQRDESNQLKWYQKLQPDEKIPDNSKQNEITTNKFNRKIHPDSPVKTLNNQNVRQSTYNGNVKKFSDTVKKLPLSSPKNSATKENIQKKNQEIKPELSEVNNTLISKTQWISVSNKKKRRNRNMEETDESFDSLIVPQEKEPEMFEQNAFLQDIIVNSNLNNVNKQENTSLAEKVAERLPEIIRTSPVRILEVRELEKELLNNVGIVIKEEEQNVEVDDKNLPMPKSKNFSKKKSKKSNQKQVTKRIIITDADLSGNQPETKNEDISADLQKNLQEIKIIEVVQEQTAEVPPEEAETNEMKTENISTTIKEIVPNENQEKKSKKKKKKQSKVVEISSSNTTLNSCEDTYDLLLENTFSSNSDDKTNMEISQELDLIIQRGMYNNLEEKIKSLNIIPIREEFFQSVVQNSRESSTEKTPEFSKFLSNSMPKFKYCMATMGDDALKVPLNHFDQPSTSKDLFVENLEVNELLKDIYGTDGIPATEMKEVLKMPSPPKDINIEGKNENSVVKQVDSRESSVPKTELDTEKLYPITLAVKKWMTKTRENTPEVEILKSPSVIFKEFCEKPELEKKKRNSGTFESDEEVTVYSLSRNNSGAVDLLDCWENEISSSDFEGKSSVEVSCDNESNIANDNKDEEVLLEIYESKYGQNEDFIELQKEIEEKKRQETDSRSRNFPKHGALPYRAICCNVM